jgi:excisionase family DNA binding protein
MNVLDLDRIKRADALLDLAKAQRPDITETAVDIAAHYTAPEDEQSLNHSLTPMEPLKVYTPAEVATMLSVHPETVMRYIRAGKIRALGGGRGRAVRISLAELERFWKEQGAGDLIRTTADEPAHA